MKYKQESDMISGQLCLYLLQSYNTHVYVLVQQQSLFFVSDYFGKVSIIQHWISYNHSFKSS